MEFVRTPDDRFDNLHNYPFKPNYLEIPDSEGGKLRMHYVGDGPEDMDTIQLFTDAWEVYDRWEKPFLTAYGKADPILGWFDKVFQEYIPGAKGQPHIEFSDGVHFIQEQYDPELARIMNDFIAATTS